MLLKETKRQISVKTDCYKKIVKNPARQLKIDFALGIIGLAFPLTLWKFHGLIVYITRYVVKISPKNRLFPDGANGIGIIREDAPTTPGHIFSMKRWQRSGPNTF